MANLAAVCSPCHKDKTKGEAAAALRAIAGNRKRPTERHPGLIDG
jgi:5-methylcytosine-specific restriction endonuclease McrA